VAEASRSFDMAPTEIEEWVDEGKRGMKNVLRAKPSGDPRGIRATAEGAAGGLRRGHAGASCPKEIAVPAERGRQVIETIPIN
jgi:hypothetical protein